MDAAKKFMTDNPSQFISFGDGLPRTVKLMKDKEDTMPDMNNKGQNVTGVKFLVETEDGTQKTFFTTSFALIGKLAGFAPGTIVTIQQKKMSVGGQFRTTYIVSQGASIKSEDDGSEVGDDEVPSTETTW